jgi:hypothetical protein
MHACLGVMEILESKIQTTRTKTASDTMTHIERFFITLVTFGINPSTLCRLRGFFVGASSPVLFLYDESSLVDTSFPSILTVLVPDEVSLDFAMFG